MNLYGFLVNTIKLFMQKKMLFILKIIRFIFKMFSTLHKVDLIWDLGVKQLTKTHPPLFYEHAKKYS